MANYSDDFERTDSGSLGADWVDYLGPAYGAGQLGIVSGEAVTQAVSNDPIAEYAHAMDTVNQTVTVTVGSEAPVVIRLYVRSNGGDNYVMAHFQRSGSFVMYISSSTTNPYDDGGGLTAKVSTTSQSFAAGDVLEFSCHGTLYRLSKNGTVINRWSDIDNSFSFDASNNRVAVMVQQTTPVGGGIEDFSAVDADSNVPYIVATDGNLLNTVRTASTTLTGYIPLENDLIVMWVNSNSTASITVPTGWENPLGGNTDVESDAHQACCIYHVVTSAEETAVTTTYTATNLWDTNEVGNYHAIAVRNTSGIDAYNSTFDNTDTATPHVLAGLTGGDLEDNSLVVSSLSRDNVGNYTVANCPSGWGLVQVYGGGMGHATVQRDAFTSAGVAVSSVNYTPAAADEYISITVAFAAAAASSSSASTPDLFFHWLID